MMQNSQIVNTFLHNPMIIGEFSEA